MEARHQLPGMHGGRCAALSLLLLVAGLACSSWRDETKGTALAGLSGDCSSCSAYFTEASTCVEPDCPAADELCEGAAAEALAAFVACVCSDCAAECADMCGAGGGGITGASEACQGCMEGSASGACSNEAMACLGS